MTSPVIDGFWLPQALREKLIQPSTPYEMLAFFNGVQVEPGTPGAITVRWPIFDFQQWGVLLNELRLARQVVPTGQTFWKRLISALMVAGTQLSNPQDSVMRQALEALPIYTGYSRAMIDVALSGLELVSLENMPQAFRASPTRQAMHQWQSLPDLPGLLRFFPTSGLDANLSHLPLIKERALFDQPAACELVVGYGAGNVPGTALMIGLLAQATVLSGQRMPAAVIKNSRREPIFSPLVFHLIEQIDPELVSSLAVLVWDYDNLDVQSLLLTQADLVIAAASDETIAQIQRQLVTANRTGGHRFHAHGHKVSFSAIGAEMLSKGLNDPNSDTELIDIVALLAGLDSVFWDQHGCLSSRIHFVERSEGDAYTPEDYAQRLDLQLTMIGESLPRGAWPRQQLHDRFDRYKLLESSGQVRVFSQYDAEHLVVYDPRPISIQAFMQSVNECQGRVIIVRPVADLMEIPRYLGMLPKKNLQSLSLALGGQGEGLNERTLRFAEACGDCGVTAIRSVGRAAFPQLTHSWDGLIPLDLLRHRPAGYFTTIEFNQPYEQMLETYQRLHRRVLERVTFIHKS